MPQVAYRMTRSRRRFMNADVVVRELATTLDDVVKPH